MRTLFLLRSFNDTDHFTPLIWKFLQEKEEPVVLFHSSVNWKNDYRLQFLQAQGLKHIHQWPDTAFEKYSAQMGSERKRSLWEKMQTLWYYLKRSRRGRIGHWTRKLFYSCEREMKWLRENKISATIFEWGNPYARGEVVEKLFIASKSLGISVFAIPHGLNINLNSDMHEEYRKTMRKGMLPNYSNQNHFDHYWVQSRFHAEHLVRFGMDRNKVSVMGSVRFDPTWQKMNLNLCTRFEPSKNAGERLKVVFMVPHWNYNVNKDNTLKMLDRIVESPEIHLVIKDHTRGDVGLIPKGHRERYSSKNNVEIDVKAHSPALIAWSDAVICFSSSIAIEALQQDKALVCPSYLHENETIFDRTGAAFIVNDEASTLACLLKLKTNPGKKIPQKNISTLYQSLIYGNREPCDVLSFYHQEIKKRATLI